MGKDKLSKQEDQDLDEKSEGQSGRKGGEAGTTDFRSEDEGRLMPDSDSAEPTGSVNYNEADEDGMFKPGSWLVS